ncbi:hypothetical protein [Halorubrum sp. N11]|uniref:hypothetical protein n=1 Tax=Halorubrum sp. N11 TaxID=3402276 RepID=UPI003EBCE682
MQRRRFIAGAALATAGCLEFEETASSETATDETEATPNETTTDDDTGGEPSDQESNVEIYERGEAIDRAAHFAVTDAPAIVDPSGMEPAGIEFATSAAGSSTGSEAGGQYYTTESLVVTPTTDERLSFGGSTGNAVRVTDAVVDASATFTPDSTDTEIDAGRFDVNVDGDGTLLAEGIELRDTDQEEPLSLLEGEWSGDEDLFRHYPFGTYSVELIKDGDTVAHTGEQIAASGYAWLSAQSASSLFVTRHNMVSEEWHVELNVGRPPDEVGSIAAIHHPDDHVFEFDLNTIDADPGTYPWEVTIRDSEIAPELARYLSLRSSPNEPIQLR